jgi:hypothetical protein
MNAREATALGEHIARLVRASDTQGAYNLLAPVLAERTPFRYLDRIGAIIGAEPLGEVNPFLALVAGHATEGGWVVIASALGAQLARDPGGALSRCRGFIIQADVWYGADIIGERVPGPALVGDFQPSLALIAPWRGDENRWVRRAVGVAVHLWAKRSRGAQELEPQAERLLEFLEPMFDEWDMDAAKGVAWGLKTLGRYYPERVAEWLAEQVTVQGRRHRAVMVRKAMTYLSEEQRRRITGVNT